MKSSISASAGGVVINGDNLTVMITSEKLVVKSGGGLQSNSFGWSVVHRFVINGVEYNVTKDTTLVV